VVIGVIAGLGFTVTVTVKSVPAQLPDFGVTVYMAVCAVLVVLVRVPLMFEASLPASPPVNPVPAGADQLYVVPAGTIPLVTLTGVTVNPASLHTVVIIAVIVGFGSIATITVNVDPAQLPDVGVTV
jgi:hypothetical protein